MTWCKQSQVTGPQLSHTSYIYKKGLFHNTKPLEKVGGGEKKIKISRNPDFTFKVLHIGLMLKVSLLSLPTIMIKTCTKAS